MQLDRLIKRCNGRGSVVPTHADGHEARATLHNLGSAGASPHSQIAARTEYGTQRLWVTLSPKERLAMSGAFGGRAPTFSIIAGSISAKLHRGCMFPGKPS